MIKKYSFLPVFSCLLLALTWWTSQVGPLISRNGDSRSADSASTAQLQKLQQRRELLETLDKIVAYEHYYHSVYGHFTKLMGRIGVEVRPELKSLFDIRITEATGDHFLVTALSEENGRVTDMATVDQEFQVHSNFEMPSPRAEYLKSQALKQIRLLKEAPAGYSVSEQGIFKGYFKYDVSFDSEGRKYVTATGMKYPVIGLQLKPNSESDLSFLPGKGEAVGQMSTDKIKNLQEEAFLAQKIFVGETGRYPKTWTELSQIANFRFEGKEEMGDSDELAWARRTPASETSEPMNLEFPKPDQKVSEEKIREITSKSRGKPLEIESIPATSH